MNDAPVLRSIGQPVIAMAGCFFAVLLALWVFYLFWASSLQRKQMHIHAFKR
jgi:high-affinity Fe2+/Pb2+ permease